MAVSVAPGIFVAGASVAFALPTAVQSGYEALPFAEFVDGVRAWDAAGSPLQVGEHTLLCQLPASVSGPVAGGACPIRTAVDRFRRSAAASARGLQGRPRFVRRALLRVRPA